MSPIERMIDEAAGYRPDKDIPIILRCPFCGKTKRTYRMHHDPESARVIVYSCEECRSKGGKDEEVQYE